MPHTPTLRALTSEDRRLLFEWRNRPEIVALGSLQKSVSWEEHSCWFDATLRGDNRTLYVVEEDGRPIGQVRFDWNANREGEVSIYVLPEFTGRGVGVSALAEGCRLAFASGRASRLTAHIRKENPRSLHAFSKVGFIPCTTADTRSGHDRLYLYQADQVVPHNRLTYGSEEAEAVAEVVRSGNWACGELSARLETRLADCAGVAGAVVVGSGLGALRLALLALGIKAGDAVAVPAYSCVALANAVLACGAEAVPVDVEPDTWNMSPDALRVAAGARSNLKAVIAVHTFGQPARIADLAAVGFPVIEDCSHAFGASNFGKLGAAAVLSLYTTKLLGGGQGGGVLSDNGEILAGVRDGCDYTDRAASPILLNDRSTDIEASLVLCQLDRLPAMLARRAELAGNYQCLLRSRVDGTPGVKLPSVLPGRIWYRYAVSVPDADEIVARMALQGVTAASPVHNWLEHDISNFPVSEQAYRTLLSLPLYPSLSDFEQERVADTFLHSLSQRSSK